MSDPCMGWLVILGGMCQGLLAMALAANDCANSMGTSVGSKALTLKQAVILGSIFELAGAFLLGKEVAKTISKGIIDTDAYSDDGPLFAMCMLCVLFGSGVAVMIATFKELPISASHGIIGGLMGVGIAAKGWDSIGVSNVVKAVISWVTSPAVGLVCSMLICWTVEKTILLTPSPLRRAITLRPILIAGTIFILVLFVLMKGPGKSYLDMWEIVVIAIAGGVVAGLVSKALYTYVWPTKHLLDQLPSADDEVVPVTHGSDGKAMTALPAVKSNDTTNNLDSRDKSWFQEPGPAPVSGDVIDPAHSVVIVTTDGSLPVLTVPEPGIIGNGIPRAAYETSTPIQPASNEGQGLARLHSYSDIKSLQNQDKDAHIDRLMRIISGEVPNPVDVDRTVRQRFPAWDEMSKAHTDDNYSNWAVATPGGRLSLNQGSPGPTAMTPYTGRSGRAGAETDDGSVDVESGMTAKEIELARVEDIFRPLLVVSACIVAFAHGANDVGNAIGPMAAILEVSDTGTVAGAPNIPLWLLALGGCEFALGILTQGYKTIKTVGSKLTQLTLSRAYATQLGAAVSLLVASAMGMPVSTSHCLVGSVLGVGFAQRLHGHKNPINMMVLLQIGVSWFLTIPIAAGITIGTFYALRSMYV